MHFDQRTQAALRDVGLTTEEIRTASDAVADAVERDAETIRAFFEGGGTMYSDMEMAHSADEIQEHEVAFVDLFTHGSDLRGYLRFDSWGVPVEGGRVLNDETVELSLGPTVDARVRFARDPDSLR
jgi:predicted deacylase